MADTSTDARQGMDLGAAEGRPINKAAVVGAGLIGSRWAALFLAAGLEVTIAVRSASREAAILDDIASAWPALRRLGRTGLAEPPRPAFATDIEEGLRDADWVQENWPDDEQLKLELMPRLDDACRPDAVIASSTSGILPSTLQSVCRHPERVVVGHPFFPAHIMPLVEVVGGRQTSQSTLKRAMAFYTSIGKKPLLCRTEAPGFITNRLQEGIIREFIHLVNDGIATTAELDYCVSNGPGLRWALFGPAFIYMMSGGPGGMAAALRQFDPSHVDDWGHAPYPEMSDRLIDELDAQTARQAEGRSLAEWEALRDEFLIRLIELKDELMGTTPMVP